MKHMYRALLALLVTFVSLHSIGQTISGPGWVCTGSSMTLMGSPVGGTWTSSTPAIATVNTTTGVVTGISNGGAVISYITGSGTATYPVTVLVTPAAIGGTASLCVGMTTTLTDVNPGGTWSSSNVAIAPVGSSTGVVTGVSAGTTNITYSFGSCFTTRIATVNPMPAAISGSTSISCSGTTTLTDVTPGGVWSSSTPSIATVSSATGVVTGVSSGPCTITYTLGTGCFRTVVVTVTGAASPGVISGSSLICLGSPVTLSETVSGGVWSTVAGHASITSTGVVTGLSAGLDTVIYTVTGPCGTATASFPITISATPTVGSISGALSLCTGMTTTLSCTPSGGTWTSSTTTVASVSSITGIVSGITAGVATISYNIVTGCGSATATAAVSVNPAPGAITGAGTGWLCVGSSVTLSNSLSGGTWSSSFSSVSVGASSGIVTGVSFGLASITYSVPGGCIATTMMTVNPVPTVSASATPAACGPMYTGVASGASTYSWAPATGVSCSTCATTNLSVSSTTTYTVTGSNGACSSSATVTVNGNRIDGHIFFSSTAPSSPACKVWLVQFDPTDSTITGVDSTNTCLDSGIPYYEFASKPAGSYMVKAKLNSSVAGTSGYIPTYGSSTPYWYLAASVGHTSATDVQNIMMAYGTVPAGPGFISGYVVSGAGKGTSSDAPVAGMIIYLKKASTGEIVTYTYTDATGAYSFGSLGYGNYIVHPEEFDYYTTASAAITLNASTPSVTTASFKKYTTSHIIVPYALATNIPMCYSGDFRLYPNPTTGYVNIAWGAPTTGTGTIIIRDLSGREVMNTSIEVANATESKVNVSNIATGIYFMTVNTGAGSHTEKLIIK